MPAPLPALLEAAGRALNAGRWDELRHYAEAVLQQDPAQPDGWFFLSLVASNQGQFGQSLTLVARALALQPDNAEYLIHQARCHAQRYEHAAALTAADRAATLQPQGALLLDTLGVVYSRLGEHQKARTALAKAVANAPANAQFQFNLGSAEHVLGNTAAASSCYRQALALKPDFCRAWWALAELGKGDDSIANDGNGDPGAASESLSQMLSLRARSDLSVPDQLYLGHAIAREYEKQGEYRAAFEALERGKQGRLAQAGQARLRDGQLFEALLTAFPASQNATSQSSTEPASFVPTAAASACFHQSPHATASERLTAAAGANCLFIVGMPRSGSTLLERMLAMHSQVLSLGELQDFPLAVKKASGSRSPNILDAETIRAALQADPASIAAHYQAALHGRAQPGLYCIDKLPLNFLQLGFILRALPAARIICVRRNPLDTILANYRQLFALNFSWYDYHYSLEETARYYLQYERLLRHWQQRHGRHLHVLDYEALLAEPESTLRQALQYLGLPWQAACLQFHTDKVAVSTASSMQVRQPLYHTARERWRHYREQLAPAVAILRAGGINCEDYESENRAQT